MAPKKYIDKMLDSYQRIFGSKPRQYSTPLEHGDHPGIDDSEELGLEDIKKFQSMIGALQWVIQIRRFDINTAVMTLSSFRANPRPRPPQPLQAHLRLPLQDAQCCHPHPS
jgi:hypothetical protein